MKNKYFLLLLIGLFIFGCKPYENTRVRKNQVTYTKYRQTQLSFKSKDGVIKYIDKGDGPVIVLLHGVPTSGWIYRKMMKPLVQSGYRVIVPDMLGFGSSDSPDGYNIYNESNHAKRLLALMDSLGIDQWTHVMHDVGGIWTWELMKQAPNRINKLVMLNTLVYEEGFHPPMRFTRGGAAKTVMWSYRNGITTNKMLKILFNEGLVKNDLNELDIEGYKTPLVEGKTNGMYYFFTTTCNEYLDYSDVFENLEIPITAIWGIHDTFLQWTPQQSKIIENLKLNEEKNVHLLSEKHFIQETKHEGIVLRIVDFIRKN